MPDFVLFILMIISIVAAFISIGVCVENNTDHHLASVPITIMIALCGWWTAYFYQPLLVDHIDIYKSSRVNNVDVVVINNSPLNLNTMFGRVVEPDSDIKVTSYKKMYITNVGVYCTTSSKDNDQKIEIVDDTKK